MSIEKMTLVRISGELSKVEEVMSKCSQTEDFHPESVTQFTDKKGRITYLTQDNPHIVTLNKITVLSEQLKIALPTAPIKHVSVPKDFDTSFVDEISARVSALIMEKQGYEDSIAKNEIALTQLAHIESVDVNLDDIFSCEYINVRFGILPAENFSKLEYYKNEPFLFFSLDKDKDAYWCVYFTPNEHVVEVDNIFASLYFERVWIPEDAHGTPDFARQSLNEQIQNNKQKLAKITKELSELPKLYQEKLYNAYINEVSLRDYFDIRKYVVVINKTFKLVGFIPTSSVEKFTGDFNEIEGVSAELMPSDSNRLLSPPTRLKNNRIFKPFEMFVEMYGLPGYNDIDPTPFVAITYTLMFGIMFGDLGQGVIVALLGYFLWKKKEMVLGRIMIRLGFSSACFGFLYGSVFGFEDILTPFYVNVLGLPGKPIHIMAPSTTNLILGAAVALGAVIIVTSILINIFLGFKQKNYERAIFSCNGIAGLVFYGYCLTAAVGTLLMGVNMLTTPLVLGFIVLPLLIIFLEKPLSSLVKGKKDLLHGEPVGGFLAESFFELFEVVLSFVTNTMSFLRIGGFVMVHAGMMAVVLTLSEMVNTAGTGTGIIASALVIVIGNIFVMCMEGLIVGIQVLRLEFYEMFSRYFEGNGKPFVSVATNND